MTTADDIIVMLATHNTYKRVFDSGEQGMVYVCGDDDCGQRLDVYGRGEDYQFWETAIAKHQHDLLDTMGVLTEPTAGQTLKTKVEWGIMMNAGYPADEEVGTGWESEEAARAEVQRIRNWISSGDISAEDYEPMHVVRRYVTLPKHTPWEIVP